MAPRSAGEGTRVRWGVPSMRPAKTRPSDYAGEWREEGQLYIVQSGVKSMRLSEFRCWRGPNSCADAVTVQTVEVPSWLQTRSSPRLED